jgi:hypothetical protein
MKWLMWYNNKKIYITTKVGRGSHYFDDNEEYHVGPNGVVFHVM